MYAIKVKLSQYSKNKTTERLLKKRYKTLRGAEKAAGAHRWVCKPDGDNQPPVEECNAWVIPVEQLPGERNAIK